MLGSNGAEKAQKPNLAHAFAFPSRYDEALAIYRRHRDKPLNRKSFGETTACDQGESAGFNPSVFPPNAALGKERKP